MKLTIIIAFSVAAAIAALFAYGALHWNVQTRALHKRLGLTRTQPAEPTVNFRELGTLPPPVQRYLRLVLTDGAPIIVAARFHHTGTFNSSEAGERWSSFTSVQDTEAHGPAFIWDARIHMIPRVPVRVHDAYIAGQGLLHASILGAFSVADLHDTTDIAAGELMRWLAETTWYPTALLSSQGIRWTAVDAHSARATLVHGTLTITLLYTFGVDGLIETVLAESRSRTVANRIVPTPWQGRFWNYEKRDGLLVPLDGEVSWLLPSGPKPYWRGHLDALNYLFADPTHPPATR